ncbi:hypothetical protein [Deinococcus apachensis]|uniref:hypothetical protein n=1 Tax=Deinococcus apachensis TaxID=309886 RepID=UPI00039F76E5|nr:hypothetical protein [Deinococcus apachensis]
MHQEEQGRQVRKTAPANQRRKEHTAQKLHQAERHDAAVNAHQARWKREDPDHETDFAGWLRSGRADARGGPARAGPSQPS